MTERSLFWDGEVLGDCGPYTTQDLHDCFFRSLLNGTGDRGVVKGWRDELEVSGISSPVSVAAGGAVVYGEFFDTDLAVAVAVSTPSSGFSRYDRIVVRRDWATQTARIARVVGVAAAAPAMPALTQTANITWEIPLATLLVDDAGNITVSDTREFCWFSTEWPANIVVAGMYGAGVVTAAKRPDRARWQFQGAGQLEPDSANPCTRAAGATYDYWAYADAAFTRGWVYFLVPEGVVGNVSFFVWSTPDVNGAGLGVENCQWDYSIYYGVDGGALNNAAGTVNVDQQLRVNTTAYRDQVPAAALGIGAGQIVAFRLSRDGAADSYNSVMRLHGVEMYWTAEA